MEPDRSFVDLVRHRRPPGPSNLIEPIATYLAARGSAKRNTLSRQLESEWRQAGGAALSGSEWDSTAEREAWNHRVKRALSRLRDDGRVRESRDANGRRIHGTWEWIAAQQLPESAATASEAAELNVGTGKHLVYGLYDQREKDAAHARGEGHWLIKVGKTRARTPYQRIQDGAFLSDRLLWAIALWTDDPEVDERLVKGVLERRGRRYNGTGGTEWFVTSPEEIQNVYLSIIGNA